MGTTNLDETLNTLEKEVLLELEPNRPNSPYDYYRTEFPMKLWFEFPHDDGVTTVTINTKSKSVHFGKSEEDANNQLDLHQFYTKRIEAKRILKWIEDRIYEIDPQEVKVEYGSERGTERMDYEDVELFMRYHNDS